MNTFGQFAATEIDSDCTLDLIHMCSVRLSSINVLYIFLRWHTICAISSAKALFSVLPTTWIKVPDIWIVFLFTVSKSMLIHLLACKQHSTIQHRHARYMQNWVWIHSQLLIAIYRKLGGIRNVVRCSMRVCACLCGLYVMGKASGWIQTHKP